MEWAPQKEKVTSWDDFFSLKAQEDTTKSVKSELICQPNLATHITRNNGFGNRLFKISGLEH